MLDKITAEEFEKIIFENGAEKAIPEFIDVFNETGRHFSKSFLQDCNFIKPRTKNVKTIGIIYSKLTNGGVERVISLQIPIFIKMGYRVVLLTDVIEPEREYNIPAETIRVKLPCDMPITTKNYRARAEALTKAIKDNNIDLLIYHSWGIKYSYYDTLLAKANGLPVVILFHGILPFKIAYNSESNMARIDLFRLADRLVVLSEADLSCWKALGCRVVYIPNPIESPCLESPKDDLGEGALWVGRFEDVQKQFWEAIKIAEIVKEKLPNFKLKMAGTVPTKQEEQEIKRYLREHKLEENVELLGYQKDIEKQYRQARILLTTSSYESFSMTLIEGAMHSLPIVAYDMPYLPIFKNNKGIKAVEQGDRVSAANAIVKIMEDDSCCRKLSKESKIAVQKLMSFNQEEAWQNLIDNVFEPMDTEPSEIGYILELSMLLADKGAKNCASKIKRAKQEIKKSRSYKIGNAIIKLPSKTKKILKK